MRYIIWALVALVGYTFVPPLMSLATENITSSVATFGAASMLALTALAVSVYSSEPIFGQLQGSHSIYVFGAGIFLSISILSFFKALSLGPVSIVVPIFGLFLVTSSLVGVVLLGETLSLQRTLGIGLAILSILVLSLE